MTILKIRNTIAIHIAKEIKKTIKIIAIMSHWSSPPLGAYVR
jgi:hypothetical protein